MKAVAIIAEFNPFHNGHKYLVEEARSQSKADVVAVIMSGNFLQRGEPAIIDKWQRAQAALANGADLVFELPATYSVQSADYFAFGGVKLAQAMKADYLAFGTDSKAQVDYQEFGQFFLENAELIEENFRKITDNELSYAQKMTVVLKDLLPDFPLDFTSPNHILAMSYAKANAKYPKPMQIFALPRIQASYHSQEITSEIASATAIRKESLAGNSINASVPAITQVQMQENPLVTWENYWQLLKYKLLSTDVNELKNIYQMTEGLEYRLKEKAGQATTFEEFMDLIKTKRYTRTRLSRLFTYILWNATQEEVEKSWEKTSLHLLAASPLGRKYLKEKKEELDLPLVSRIGKSENDSLNLRADQIYQLGHEQIKEQNFGRIPLI